MRALMILMVMSFASPLPSRGQSVPTAESPARIYHLLREDDYWSFLADPAKRQEFWDPIKYIRLRPGRNDWFLSVGGEAREVWEQIGNDNWGQQPFEIDYNILFRWFVGLNLDDEVWDATVFTKNRDRLLEAEVAKDFLTLVVEQTRGQGWASDEHFTVDGSLLEAWASAKSFQPKNKKSGPPPEDPGNPTVDYRGEKRSNKTHQSKSDPAAQLARKGAGKEAKLSYSGNLLVENRNGLIVDSRVWEATGTAERYAALEML